MKNSDRFAYGSDGVRRDEHSSPDLEEAGRHPLIYCAAFQTPFVDGATRV